ncbi:MAG: hypothetical protein IJU44_01175 [Kiritimatiellae bacterium]|nr:hypothetical protein [Kiritimatiellia bacterium]
MGLPANNGNETARTESVSAGKTAASRPADGKTFARLNRRSADGRIAVSSMDEKRLPAKAEVAMSRTEAEDARAKIAAGLSADPSSVLAMYDISINSDGQKWQPAPGAPVRVAVELSEPVAVTPGARLRVAHLADDGTVETLPESDCGFTLNAARDTVSAFWFVAASFSVYAIYDETGTTVEVGRRLYDFYSLNFDQSDPDTYNTYVPRYFTTREGNKTFRQIVKSGEYLVRPEVLPSPLGRTFIGWFLYDPNKANTTYDGVEYDEEGYAKTKFDFNKPVVFETPTGDYGKEEFVLRARFAREGYVIFHEQKNGDNWPITAVRRTPMAEVATNAATGEITVQGSVRIDDLYVTYDDPPKDGEDQQQENGTPKMIFRGWSTQPVDAGTVTPSLLTTNYYVFTRIKGTPAVARHLYPVFLNINWLSFQAAETGSGAIYNPPQHFYQDQGTNRFPTSALKGYSFSGWWTSADEQTGVQVSDANGNLVVENSDLPTTLEAAAADGAWGGYISGGQLMLAKNVELFGRWTAVPTDYTVVIWRQKSTDAANLPNAEKHYDFAQSIPRSAETGSQVSVGSEYMGYAGSGDYVGFHYSHCDSAKTVAADGTTVLNVYYDRNVHTYRFYNTDSSSINTTTNYSYSYTPIAGNLAYTTYACSDTYTTYSGSDTYTTYTCGYSYVNSYTYEYNYSKTFSRGNSYNSNKSGKQIGTSGYYVLSISSTSWGTTTYTYYIRQGTSGNWYKIPDDYGSDVYNYATSMTSSGTGNSTQYTYSGNQTFTLGAENTQDKTESKQIGTSGWYVSYRKSTSWVTTTYTYYIRQGTSGNWYQISSSNGSDIYNNATDIVVTQNTTTGSFTLGASPDSATITVLEANNKSVVGGYKVAVRDNTYYIRLADGTWRQIASNGSAVYNNATSITITPNANNSQNFSLGAVASATDAAALEASAWKKTVGDYAVSYTGTSRVYYIKLADGTWRQISTNGSTVYHDATAITVTPNANNSQSFTLGAIADAADAAALEASAWRKTVGDYAVSYTGTGTSLVYYIKLADGTWRQISTNGSTVYYDATAITVTPSANNSPSFTLGAKASAADVATLESADRKKTVGDYEVSYTGSGTSRNYYVKNGGEWLLIPSQYGATAYYDGTELEIGEADPVTQTFTVETTAVINATTIGTLEANKRSAGAYDVSYSGSTYYIKLLTDGTWHQITNNGAALWNNATDITVTVTSSNQTEVLAITALYGASIKDYFPVKVSGTQHTWKATSAAGKLYQQRLLIVEYMEDLDAYFYISDNDGKGGTIYMYVEVDEDESDGTRFGDSDKYYREYFSYGHNYNFLTYLEDFYPLVGYTNDWRNADCNGSGAAFVLNDGIYRYPGSSTFANGNNVSKFYYDRLPFELEIRDSYENTLKSTKTVLFSQKIAEPEIWESERNGYYFTGWYADQACSTRVFFDEEEFNNSTLVNKVLYDRMPAYNLRVYAGWGIGDYLIQVDPNGGELMLSSDPNVTAQSTWFWEPTVGGEPIHEYKTVTRSFVESLDGTWFYALQDRSSHGLTNTVWVSGEPRERSAYYTQDQSDPYIVDPSIRYAPATNAYRYAGWYEVTTNAAGQEVEELFAFEQPPLHDTFIRLHWKKLGTYHILYDPGRGTMSTNDENETTFKLLETYVYADDAEVMVVRTAVPPAGYAFVGWTIRNADGRVYHPGETFNFDSLYAITSLDANGNKIKQLVLDAVYSQVKTVSLTTDANGGTIDPLTAVTLPLAYPDAPTLITNITDTARTVSGMRNNAYGTLSDGTGYNCTVYDAEGKAYSLTLVGWNTKADGTGQHFATNILVGVDSDGTDNDDGHNVLYAEWAIDVYYDKNFDAADWRHGTWGDGFVFNPEEGQSPESETAKGLYSCTTTLNGYAKEPSVVFNDTIDPETGDVKVFRFWSTERYKEEGMLPQYDFNTPVTGPLTLYACWSDLITVPFHAVDASAETLVERQDWLIDGNDHFTVGNDTNVSFADPPSAYVNPSAGYQYAFTCVASGMNDVSEASRVKRVYFNAAPDARAVYVEYENGETGPMPSGKELYIVYFQNPRTLPIEYVTVNDGTVSNVSTNQTPAAPGYAAVGSEAYVMAANVTQPLSYPTASSTYLYYAFSAGGTNAAGQAQLSVMTGASGSDSERPELLRVRNSWRGIEYSTDGGENWSRYGFDTRLYVVYFTAQPTIITLNERTVGTEADMAALFKYSIVVTEFQQTHTETQRQTRPSNSSTWTDSGAPTLSDPTLVNNSTRTVSSSDKYLADGGVESVTLLYSSNPGNWSNPDGSWSRSYDAYVRNNTRTVTETIQRVVITQAATNEFATVNDTGDGVYVYEAEAESAPDTKQVTYTNTRISLPVELHVAFSQRGTIDHMDATYRNDERKTLTVPLSADGTFAVTEEMLLARADAESDTYLVKADANLDGYCFVGVFYGRANETDGTDENRVDIEGRVTSVGLVRPEGGEYYALCLNGDPTKPLGDYELYYVYCELPVVRYMKEGVNGALTVLQEVRYGGHELAMNGETVVKQGELLPVGSDVLAITPGGSIGANIFRVPVVLDGATEGSLNHRKFAAGMSGVSNLNGMDGESDSIYLKIDGAVLKWSPDGDEWGEFSPGAVPTVYAIYKEKGYDLTIVETSLASEADKANDKFTVTIYSENFDNGAVFEVSGYEDDDGTVEELQVSDKKLTLTVKSGCNVVLHALPNGELEYRITEALPLRYVMQSVTIDGYAPASQYQVENGTALFLEKSKTVEFTNAKYYNVQFVEERVAGEDDKVLTVLSEDGEEQVESRDYLYGTAVDAIATPSTIPDKPWNDERTAIYRFKGWDPQIEPVSSNAVYAAAYRSIAIPQAEQRSNGDMLTVKLENFTEAQLVALLKSLDGEKLDLESAGYDVAAANKWLNTEDANGLKRWENIVTGTEYTQPLWIDMASDGSQMTMRIWDKPLAEVKKDLGYTVRYVLEKTTGAGWNRIAGPTEDALAIDTARPGMNVTLLKEDGTTAGASGLYRVVTQIIPNQKTTVVNEIPSKNIGGILEVASSYTNTVIASPWVALDTDKQSGAVALAADPAADNVTIAKLMADVNLAAGDKIYAYDTANKVHYGWEKIANRGSETDAWESFISAAPDGVTMADPVSSTMSRGGAFWLVRPTPLAADGSLKPVFVCGQHLAGDYTVTVPGGGSTEPVCVLIANPTMYDVDINSLKFTGDIGEEDTIWVPSANPNIATTYRRNITNGTWEQKTFKYLGNRKVTVWRAEGSIPAGTGFWYTRRTAGDLTLTWDGWKETEETADAGTDGE